MVASNDKRAVAVAQTEETGHAAFISSKRADLAGARTLPYATRLSSPFTVSGRARHLGDMPLVRSLEGRATCAQRLAWAAINLSDGVEDLSLPGRSSSERRHLKST